MDDSMLTRYISQYGDMVLRVAYNYVRNYADSEDITQDVFVKLYRCDKRFYSDEHVKSWLIRVAINMAKDKLRTAWHQRTEPLSESYSVQGRENIGLCEAMDSLDEKYRT